MPESYLLKLTQAIVIDGQIVTAGRTVEVTEAEAKNLLARGKAELATDSGAADDAAEVAAFARAQAEDAERAAAAERAQSEADAAARAQAAATPPAAPSTRKGKAA